MEQVSSRGRAESRYKYTYCDEQSAGSRLRPHRYSRSGKRSHVALLFQIRQPSNALRDFHPFRRPQLTPEA